MLRLHMDPVHKTWHLYNRQVVDVGGDVTHHVVDPDDNNTDRDRDLGIGLVDRIDR